jgi:hypothetical protein
MDNNIRDRYRVQGQGHGVGSHHVPAAPPPAQNHQTPKSNSDTPNKTQVSINIGLPHIRLPKKAALLKLSVWILIILAVVAIWKWPAKNTIPANIRRQVSFHTIFPTKNYDPSSFQYSAFNHALQFNATEAGIKIQVTEQSLPANSGASPAKEPSVLLGQLGVHYYTQTQSRLGVISVAKFWTGNYTPNGQTAVLGNEGTLVLAHPGQDLNLEQWKAFFNQLSF